MDGRGSSARGGAAHRRLLIGLVPALLSLVAVTQMTLAATTELTPWRGGGFGMFSTLDSHSTRQLRIEVMATDGTRYPVDLASFGGSTGFVRATARHRAWPRAATLEELRRHLTELQTGTTDGRLVHRARDGDLAPSIDTIRVEVWRPSFDAETRRLEFELVDRARWQP